MTDASYSRVLVVSNAFAHIVDLGNQVCVRQAEHSGRTYLCARQD